MVCGDVREDGVTATGSNKKRKKKRMQQQEFLIYRMYKNVIPEHFFLAFTFQFDPDADATHHSHHKNRFCLFEEQLWSFVDTEHA